MANSVETLVVMDMVPCCVITTLCWLLGQSDLNKGNPTCHMRQLGFLFLVIRHIFANNTDNTVRPRPTRPTYPPGLAGLQR